MDDSHGDMVTHIADDCFRAAERAKIIRRFFLRALNKIGEEGGEWRQECGLRLVRPDTDLFYLYFGFRLRAAHFSVALNALH